MRTASPPADPAVPALRPRPATRCRRTLADWAHELQHGSGPWEWPRPVDVALAGCLAAFAVAGLFVDDLGARDGDDGPMSAAVVLTLLTVGPILWRRAHSVRVLLAITAGMALLGALGDGTTGAVMTQIIAMFAVAVGRSRVPAVVALLVAEAGAALLTLSDPDQSLVALFVNALALFAVWAFGRSIGFRRAYTSELEARAERLEHTREADTRAAIAEERGRIARELHDVVAHHVSVMTVQATAAQRTIARDPDRAREAMSAVEQTGRAALVEMRRLVGILRGHDDAETADARLDEGHTAPQPGLDGIDTLVAQVRDAGLPVELAIEGRPRPLTPGVDLAAYRIVQEALTNTLKHAGPAASRVLIGYGPAELLVRVADDGSGPAESGTALPERTGHGLLGMRERVSLYGGQLNAGPGPGGGFEVVARIPFTTGDNP